MIPPERCSLSLRWPPQTAPCTRSFGYTRVLWQQRQHTHRVRRVCEKGKMLIKTGGMEEYVPSFFPPPWPRERERERVGMVSNLSSKPTHLTIQPIYANDTHGVTTTATAKKNRFPPELLRLLRRFCLASPVVATRAPREAMN